MARERGRISRTDARRGTKRAKGPRERVKRVRKVMVKWKAAKESWANLRLGSEKMALLVKTWEG
jgi:hypothetical protein